ncbi:hypothetical protein MAR_021329 [Mya arenaria]|uniref:Uncharacterized protein n=1 Tax=Mya arenaria TaxID=6604 RepID=A0ABY7E7E4_MYAAR|nr:hypothetical protein MAR_021329 [Mya arenaria]
MQALDQGLSSPGRSIPVRITNECTEHVLPQLYHESSSTGTVTSGVFGGVVGGVVALAVVVVAVLIISRKYRISCLKPSDSERNTKIQSNPVFETQTASPYEHLNTREKTEYTEIGMTAVGQSGVGSPNNETSSYERLHTRENAAFTELGVSPPESQTQFESQQTDSHTASSNYEVPDNLTEMEQTRRKRKPVRIQRRWNISIQPLVRREAFALLHEHVADLILFTNVYKKNRK